MEDIIDRDAVHEALWAKYVEWCAANHVRAKLDSFYIWVDEWVPDGN